jgi:prepilin-type N-terminal cleavage/methylation domain-containing protein
MKEPRMAPHLVRRAFSLLELLVAVTIASIVVTAATVATVSIYRSTLALEQSSFANEEAKVIVDTLATQVLQVGGGQIRPWSGVSNGCFVKADGTTAAQNGSTCSGQGGTRLDLVELAEVGKQVRLASLTASVATVALLASEACPLTAANGYAATGVNVVIVPPQESGAGWQQARCVPDASTCTCALTPLGGVPISITGPVAATAAGAVMAPGQTLSIEFDAAAHSLFERHDVDDDGVVERRLLSDRVFDFRVAFGHDAAPEDGIFDGAWHTAIDTRPEGSTARRAPTLRMARVGVIVGARVTARDDAGGRASLFGNAPVTSTDYLLRAAETAVTMRNLLVFF